MALYMVASLRLLPRQRVVRTLVCVQMESTYEEFATNRKQTEKEETRHSQPKAHEAARIQADRQTETDRHTDRQTETDTHTQRERDRFHTIHRHARTSTDILTRCNTQWHTKDKRGQRYGHTTSHGATQATQRGGWRVEKRGSPSLRRLGSPVVVLRHR